MEWQNLVYPMGKGLSKDESSVNDWEEIERSKLLSLEGRESNEQQ